ncbi:MAG: class I SAM-dependent methyltransferase [Pseudomonadota bacterium]
MHKDQKFWDRVADKYFANPIRDTEVYEEKLRRSQAVMRPDMTLLEFGCGTGGTALRHAPHVAHIHATDISEAMLGHARRQAAEAGAENITFERANITDYQVAPATYDIILGLSILHLLRDPQAILANVHRWLKPGGAFISSTACLGDTMGWFQFVAPIGYALGRMPYVNVLKQADVTGALTEADFALDEVWRPNKSLGVFIIARKGDSAGPE